MRYSGVLVMLLLIGCSPDREGQGLVRLGDIALTPPRLLSSQSFFTDTAEVEAFHPMEGASITCRFEDLKSGEKIKVIAPIQSVLEGCLTCRASHPTYRNSPWSELELRQIPDERCTILDTSTPASHLYQAAGFATLTDGIKGNRDHTVSWLGYDTALVSLHIELPPERTSHRLTISTLSHHNAWIFEPQRMEVWNGENILTSMDLEVTEHIELPRLNFYDLEFAEQQGGVLTVRIQTCDSLPEWHPGAGNQGWLFIDEIIIH